MNRLRNVLIVAGCVGLLTAITLTVMEGIKYRIREDEGLDPVSAPLWVATSTYAGLAVFVLAAAALVIMGLVALGRRKSGQIAKQ